MKVKICGITSAEDIKIVNACKPDFAGFVMFFPKSKRNISPETAKSLIETLDKNVLSVAVTEKFKYVNGKNGEITVRKSAIAE